MSQQFPAAIKLIAPLIEGLLKKNVGPWRWAGPDPDGADGRTVEMPQRKGMVKKTIFPGGDIAAVSFNLPPKHDNNQNRFRCNHGSGSNSWSSLRRRIELEGSSRDLLRLQAQGQAKPWGSTGIPRHARSRPAGPFRGLLPPNSILNQWNGRGASWLATGGGPCPLEQSQDADGLLVTYQGAGRQREALRARLERWGLNACMAIADEFTISALVPTNQTPQPGGRPSWS